MTRKIVVDSNFLQRDALRDYFEKSERNYVVLTDYAAMEAYKGNTLASIHRSMEILSAYPKQVIVLKGTKTVCGLSGRTAGLQRRLIDQGQTRQFDQYCRRLQASRHGDRKFEKHLLQLGRDATAHMDLVLKDAERMAGNIERFAKTFTADDIRALRTGVQSREAVADKTLTNVFWIASFMFRDHPQVKKRPQWDEAVNTFIFRSALCMYLWVLRWISVGGAKGAKAETIRNDMVDLSFAAYATFFDGLFTCDSKLSEIHLQAVSLLSQLHPDGSVLSSRATNG